MIRTSRVIGICSNAGLAAGFEHSLIASSHHPTHTATDHYLSDTPLVDLHVAQSVHVTTQEHLSARSTLRLELADPVPEEQSLLSPLQDAACITSLLERVMAALTER
jgi:hypothetical protein